jgi:hypothetical protein
MPGVKQALAMKVVGFVNTILPMGQKQPAQVAGLEQKSVLQPGQPEKVQQAINLLCTLDPMLGDHLLGVAAIAQNNPGQYSMLVGMLKT